MATQFEDTFDFDCGAATIMRMFSDRNYYLDKYRRLPGDEPEFVDDSHDDDHYSISVRHTLEMNELPLPDFAQKRVGRQVMLNQTDAWQITTRTGRVEIDIESTPVSIVIDMQLLERDAGSRLTLAFDIRADVPLIGRKIETAMADPIKRRLHADLEETARMAGDYT